MRDMFTFPDTPKNKLEAPRTPVEQIRKSLSKVFHTEVLFDPVKNVIALQPESGFRHLAVLIASNTRDGALWNAKISIAEDDVPFEASHSIRLPGHDAHFDEDKLLTLLTQEVAAMPVSLSGGGKLHSFFFVTGILDLEDIEPFAAQCKLLYDFLEKNAGGSRTRGHHKSVSPADKGVIRTLLGRGLRRIMNGGNSKR